MRKKHSHLSIKTKIVSWQIIILPEIYFKCLLKICIYCYLRIIKQICYLFFLLSRLYFNFKCFEKKMPWKNQWTWNMNAKYLKVNMKDYVQRIEEHFTIQNVWTPRITQTLITFKIKSQLKVTRHLKIHEMYMQLIYTCGLIDN